MITTNNMLEYIDRVSPQWVAGLFDGEGCISSSLDKFGNVKLRVEIAQTNIFVLQLIMTKVPGTIISSNQLNKTGTKTTIHRIRWNDGKCLKVLEYLKDYVVIKHELVLNGIKLASLFQSAGGNGHQVAGSLLINKAALRDRIVEINKSNRAQPA